MKLSSLRAFACAVAISASMAFSPPTQAAAFQVAFDPIPELFGVATFELSTACLANNGTFSGASLLELALNGCVVSLTGAHISVTGENGVYVDYVSLLPFVILSDLMIVNNQLAGLGTFSFLPIFLDELGSPSLLTSSLSGPSFLHHPCYARLGFTISGDVSFRSCTDGVLQPALYGEITSIRQVPEPTPLALLVGAGLVGWLTRRRKRVI